MADFAKSKTRSRSRSIPSRPRSTSRPDLSRVFTGQHLDDHSTYHGRDSVSSNREEEHSTDELSDLSEEVAKKEDSELGEKLPEETVEVRNDVANIRDLEAPLEKKQSAKSVRDPNLVITELEPTRVQS